MISFHIGLHKTASTYLQKEVFPQYRECFVGSGGRGEPGAALRYLAGAPTEEYEPDRVRTLLDTLEQQHGNVFLSREALGGLLWDDPIGTGRRTASRIAALSKDVRVVICIRRQDQMLRSVYSQYVRQGGIQSPRSFADPNDGASFFDTEYLEYDRLVGTYIRALGPSQVLVLPYERLEKDQAGVGRLIASFVGGSFGGNCDRRRRNSSLRGLRLRALRRWNALFRRSRFNPSPKFRIPGAACARYLLQATPIPWRRSKRRPWLDFLPEEQAARCRSSNRRLEKMCDLDLESLGYPV